VTGEFEVGDTIEVKDQSGLLIARGMSGVTSLQASASSGMHSRDLADGVTQEVIHRDDLVILIN